MARAENITGPYTPCPYNPVLTNANTTEYCTYALETFSSRVTQVRFIWPVQTVGHADLFNDTNGNWWAVSLATRNGSVNL